MYDVKVLVMKSLSTGLELRLTTTSSDHTIVVSYNAKVCARGTGSEVIKFLSGLTQLSTKFQLLINANIPTKKTFLALSLSDAVFIMQINVKMPTNVNVAILTFMSRINIVLS